MAITQVYTPPRQAARRLVEEGVVHGLDDAAIDRIRDECWDGSEEQLEDAGLAGLLTFFYETVAAGAKDGFVWHAEEFWHDSDDVVAELAEAVRVEPPPFRQRALEVVDDGVRLVLDKPDGSSVELEASNLDDVVAAFNHELEARGATRRLVALSTDDAWQMFVAVEQALAHTLMAEGVLPMPRRPDDDA